MISGGGGVGPEQRPPGRRGVGLSRRQTPADAGAGRAGDSGRASGLLLVDHPDRPGRLTADGGVRVLERGQQRLEGACVAERAERPRGLTADGDLAVGRGAESAARRRCDRAGLRAPTPPARGPWHRCRAAPRSARRWRGCRASAPSAHAAWRRTGAAVSFSAVDQPGHAGAIAQRAERPARLLAHLRVVVLEPADERRRRAGVAQGAERPRGLFADRTLRDRASVSMRSGHAARIAERAERPGGVAAGEPDRAAAARRRPGRTPRDPIATSAEAACWPGVVTSPSPPPQLRLASQTSALERRRVVHQRDERRDRVGGAIARARAGCRPLARGRSGSLSRSEAARSRTPRAGVCCAAP